MRITDAIRGEHAVYYAWLDEFEFLAKADASEIPISAFANRLQSVLGGHAMLEDQLLFEHLTDSNDLEKPLAKVKEDHHQLNEALKELTGVTEPTSARQKAEDVLELARQHFGREESSIFPYADKYLDDSLLLKLGETWADKRGVNLGSQPGSEV
jgi:hemerythrin-like domain-containing protein